MDSSRDDSGPSLNGFIAQWAEHLARTAGAGSAAEWGPVARGLADRGVCRAFLLWSIDDPGLDRSEDERARLDDALWWSLLSPAGSPRVDLLLGGGGQAGPLFPLHSSSAIEVWTERDLCGLHALWWLARRHGRRDWASRVDAAARWHVEHTQPDNATNRPWASHVFLLLGAREPDAEARLYAETLVHNALLGVEGLDPLGRLILADSARALREAIGAQ